MTARKDKTAMIGRLFLEEDGQTNVEYGLFLFLIALASIVILVVLGVKIKNYYSNVNTKVTSTR